MSAPCSFCPPPAPDPVSGTHPEWHPLLVVSPHTIFDRTLRRRVTGCGWAARCACPLGTPRVPSDMYTATCSRAQIPKCALHARAPIGACVRVCVSVCVCVFVPVSLCCGAGEGRGVIDACGRGGCGSYCGKHGVWEWMWTRSVGRHRPRRRRHRPTPRRRPTATSRVMHSDVPCSRNERWHNGTVRSLRWRNAS